MDSYSNYFEYMKNEENRLAKRRDAFSFHKLSFEDFYLVKSEGSVETYRKKGGEQIVKYFDIDQSVQII